MSKLTLILAKKKAEWFYRHLKKEHPKYSKNLKMSKKGQSGLVVIVVAVMIFLSGMLFINYIMPDLSIAYSATGLNCADSTISDGNKLTCIGIDIVIPYFMLTVLSAAGGVIASKYVI